MLEDENNAGYRFLAKSYGERIEIKNTTDLYTELKRVYPQTEKLQSAIEREGYKESPYKNFAARSDIERLAVMHCFGGWYFDVDVMPKEPLPKKQEVEYGFQIGHEYMFDCDSNGNETLVSNGMLVATPNSNISKLCLDEICLCYDFNFKEMREYSPLDKKYIISKFYENIIHRKRYAGRVEFTMVLTGPCLISNIMHKACKDKNKFLRDFGFQYPSGGYYEAPPEFTKSKNLEFVKNHLRNPPLSEKEVLFKGWRAGLDASAAAWSRCEAPDKKRSIEAPF